MQGSSRVDPIAEDVVRAALGAILWTVCPTLFVAALLVQRIDHPGATHAALSILGAAVVLTAAKVWWSQHPPARAHLAAAITIVVLQLCLVGQIFAIREPALATFQVILAIGTASFLIDFRWVLGLQVFGLAAWLVPTALVEPTPDWQLARFVVAVGFLTAGGFFFGRKHSFDRVRRLYQDRNEKLVAARRSEEALRDSERRLRDAQRMAHVGSYEWDLATDELVWSDEHYRIFGWEPGERLDNRRFIEAVHPDDRDRLVQATARSLRDGDLVDLQYRFLRPDGEQRVLHAAGKTTRDASGKPTRHAGTSYDITEHLGVQEDLRASEARLSAILTAMDAGRVVVVGRDGVVRRIVGTPDRTGRYGITSGDVEGTEIHQFLPGGAGDRLMEEVSKVYETGERAEVEATVEFPKGVFHFDVSLRAMRSLSGEVESVLAIVRDMTAQRIEAQARRQAQKLESLGVMAGGIAHDFNNLLVGILNNAETAVDVLGRDSPVSAELEDILRASLRAAELTQEMLAYAGDARLSTGPVDLHELVEDAAGLLRANLPEGVDVALSHGASPVWVEADATQVRQVVMNFINNGAEAIAAAGGAVRVRVDTVEVDTAYLEGCYLQEAIEPGVYGRIEVVDHGVGMDRVTLERIFEPFFTTKSQGRGLGLASTVGIIRAHGGTLRVASELNVGTTIGVLLPLAAPAAETAQARGPVVAAPKVMVLVVDDEDIVRTAVARMLNAAGHEVIEASSGPKAVGLLESEETQIDLALVDVTMPELNGEETFDALRAVDPQIPVIFMSGHSSEEIARRIADKDRAGYVNKPFRRTELMEAIASCLGRPGPAGP